MPSKITVLEDNHLLRCFQQTECHLNPNDPMSTKLHNMERKVLLQYTCIHYKRKKLKATVCSGSGSGSQCWYFSHEPSSLFHYSVSVDLSVSMMMH